ncbi:MAG: hypothetical protein E7158_01500 [Firmicutes bacterium]|nr:hypothetical protein [Bacillota bacterium]
MKILIVCSTKFYNKIEEISNYLKDKGFDIIYPNGYNDEYTDIDYSNITKEEHIELFQKFFKMSEDKVKEADLILALNYDKEKGGVIFKNYVGPSTFLEIYNAFRLNKKIYLYNDIPDNMLHDEIEAFKPIIINGNLSKILVKK